MSTFTVNFEVSGSKHQVSFQCDETKETPRSICIRCADHYTELTSTKPKYPAGFSASEYRDWELQRYQGLNLSVEFSEQIRGLPCLNGMSDEEIAEMFSCSESSHKQKEGQ